MNTPDNSERGQPLAVPLSDQLGPVGWRFVPSDAWGAQLLTQDPHTVQLARHMGRDLEPLYTEAQMLARVAAERERWAPLRAMAMQVVDADDKQELTQQMIDLLRAAVRA